MFGKKQIIGCVCAASFLWGAGIAIAQTAPSPQSLPQQAEQPGQAPHAAVVPDDLRLTIMIRNAVIALNQANMTGNYSVLRDMGTPAFQMSNSSARLAELFTALRARKLDLSPIMFFNPKLLAPPSVQDGQVIRLAGFFPTSPEQVNFELAFQQQGDHWMLAGIAVNTAMPADAQISAAPVQQPGADPNQTAAKPTEARPVRIDLSQPPAQQANGPATPPKKPAAAKKPPKPKPQTAATANAAPPATATADQPVKVEPKEQAKSSDSESSWNPFR